MSIFFYSNNHLKNIESKWLKDLDNIVISYLSMADHDRLKNRIQLIFSQRINHFIATKNYMTTYYEGSSRNWHQALTCSGVWGVFGFAHPVPLNEPPSLANQTPWKLKTGGWIRTACAVDSSGNIHVGSWDNLMYCLTAQGRIKWKFDAKSKINSSPVIDDNGRIYFGCQAGILYCLDSQGRKYWQREMEDPQWSSKEIKSSPALDSQGNIYVGCYNGYLYCFSPEGTEKWKFRVSQGGISSSPVIDNKRYLYFACHGGKAYCLDLNGQEKWRFSAEGMISSSLIVDRCGNVYFASQSTAYCLYPNGREKWSYKVSDEYTWIKVSPAVDKFGNSYFCSWNHNLYCFDPNGKEKWRFKTKSILHSPPAIDQKGDIFFGSRDHFIYCLSSSGKLKRLFKTGGAIDAPIVIDPYGYMYVGSKDGYIYKLDTKKIGYHNGYEHHIIDRTPSLSIDKSRGV